MAHRTRALAALVMIVPLAVGCARATRDQQVSASPATPPPAVPAQPPVTASGVVAGYDAATGIVSFEDGRMVKLTSQSKVFQTGLTPGLRPGARVVVQNALPVGLPPEPTNPARR
jgi:hypothetical protein